jgi:hypothetical protein
MRQEIQLLLKNPEVERRVISILESLNLVKPGASCYSKLVVTKSGTDDINVRLVEEEDVEKLRKIFPPGKRSNVKLIREKMTRFLQEHPEVTVDKILKAAYLWVYDKGEYCGDAQYFFFKKERDGTELSRCLEFLDYVEPDQDLEYVI